MEKIFQTHSKASKSEILTEFKDQNDKVKLELSPYDLSRGRITFRYK